MAGYNGYSMSNNAVKAYSEGKVPLSKINTEILNQFNIPLSVKDVKAILKEEGPCEWHHTSCHYNCTNFYNLSGLAEIFNNPKPEIKIDYTYKNLIDNQFQLSRINASETVLAEQLKSEEKEDKFAKHERILFENGVEINGLSRNQIEKIYKKYKQTRNHKGITGKIEWDGYRWKQV